MPEGSKSGVPAVPLRYMDSQVFMVGQYTDEYPIGMDKRGPIVVPSYDERFIDYFADRLKYHVRDGYDVIILVTGKRRRGKSNCINAIHLKVDPKFPVGNVAFTLEDFYQVFASNPYADPENGIYPQAAADESGFAMNARNWMESAQRHLEQKFEVGGIKREIVSLTLPHRMKLDSAIREDMAVYWIHIKLYEGKRGLAILREGIENEFEQQMYWEPLCVFRFLPLEGPWWEEYTARKKLFVDGTLASGAATKESERVRQLTEQRNKALRQLYTVTRESHREIARRVDMPLSTVDKILNYSSH
jgi:hypothetical protein